jgi:hypothetical protein
MEVRDKYKKETGNILDDNYFYDLYVVLFCPICKNYNLINAYWDHTYGETIITDEYDIYNGDAVEEKFLYPINSSLISQKADLIPQNVIINFERAIDLKNRDKESCLIKLRKTIEMLCLDKNAEGDNLYHKLIYLSEIGILPKTLNSASALARKLGNIGAHESNIDISSTELRSVIELVEYIIQYIYVLPKEIEKLEKKFNLNDQINTENQ